MVLKVNCGFEAEAIHRLHQLQPDIWREFDSVDARFERATVGCYASASSTDGPQTEEAYVIVWGPSGFANLTEQSRGMLLIFEDLAP